MRSMRPTSSSSRPNSSGTDCRPGAVRNRQLGPAVRGGWLLADGPVCPPAGASLGGWGGCASRFAALGACRPARRSAPTVPGVRRASSPFRASGLPPAGKPGGCAPCGLSRSSAWCRCALAPSGPARVLATVALDTDPQSGPDRTGLLRWPLAPVGSPRAAHRVPSGPRSRSRPLRGRSEARARALVLVGWCRRRREDASRFLVEPCRVTM
jgi:hypothetical protein